MLRNAQVDQPKTLTSIVCSTTVRPVAVLYPYYECNSCPAQCYRRSSLPKAVHRADRLHPTLNRSKFRRMRTTTAWKPTQPTLWQGAGLGRFKEGSSEDLGRGARNCIDIRYRQSVLKQRSAKYVCSTSIRTACSYRIVRVSQYDVYQCRCGEDWGGGNYSR